MLTSIVVLANNFEKIAKADTYSAGMLFYCPDDGTILLLHRSEIMRNPNLWDIPGGRSKKTDKDILDTAKRETTEELETLPKDKKLLTKYIIHKKDKNKYHVFIYAISAETKEKWTSSIKLDKENNKFKWFKITKFPDNLRYDLSWLPEILADKGRIKISSNLNKLEYTLPRFEYKFIVPETSIPEIQEFLEPYVEPDEHGKFYKIKNLYFDTPNLRFFQNHLTQDDRFKLRIRTYNDDKNGYLEIKRKNNGQIIKTRNKFEADEYPTILSDQSNKFTQLMLAYRAEPTLAINYQREAYFLKDDPTTRITFDRHIKYQPTSDIDLGQNCDQSILPNSMVILEVKFYNKMPEKISNMIKRFDLTKEPMSKYITAIINTMFADKNELNLNQELFNQLFNLLHSNKDKRLFL